jgi:flagellar hook-associated protein 3 FlgL
MRSSLDGRAEVFLANLSRAQNRLNRAEQQLSSGRRLVNASDAPDEVSPLLQLRAALSRNTQIQSNLVRAGAEANSAQQMLDQALKLTDRALTLASQGNSPNMTPELRKNLAGEVEGIQELMVTVAQTRVEGRYIFSGDSDQVPAYELNLTAGTGVNELTNAGATRRLEDPAGGSFATSRTARDIFDLRNWDDSIAQGNVFNALNTLRVALLNDDTAGITGAIGLVKAASGHLNGEIGFFGNVQKRVEGGTNFAKSDAVRLQSSIADKQDADFTAAAVELSQANLQVQAALQARAKVPRTTLFDVLG